MSNPAWDAIVIGGGPAGSLAGRQLAQRGWRVLVVDKQQHPRDKVCGGCLGAVGLAALDEAGLSLGGLGVASGELTHVRVCAGGASAGLPLRGRRTIDRRVLDARLRDAARDAGATFRELTEARPTDGGALLRPAEGAAEWEMNKARLVIVAAGLGSHRLLEGLPTHAGRTPRIGAGAIVADPGGVDLPEGQVLMACGGGEGYVGVARLADGSLDVAAALRPESIGGGRHRLGDTAARVLRSAGRPIPGIEQAAWRATPRLTQRPSRVGVGNTLLIGDAAGYVEPFTGEGIGWALRGALEATPIADAFLGGQIDDPADRWNRRHAATIGRWLLRCRWVCGAIGDRPMTGTLVRGLSLAPWIAGPVMQRIDPLRPTPASTR